MVPTHAFSKSVLRYVERAGLGMIGFLAFAGSWADTASLRSGLASFGIVGILWLILTLHASNTIGIRRWDAWMTASVLVPAASAYLFSPSVRGSRETFLPTFCMLMWVGFYFYTTYCIHKAKKTEEQETYPVPT